MSPQPPPVIGSLLTQKSHAVPEPIQRVLDETAKIGPIPASLMLRQTSIWQPRRKRRAGNPRRQERLNTLVDRYTGKAFVTDPWPALTLADEGVRRDEVSDPGWNSTSFETARRRAARLVATIAVRHLRLAGNPHVKETESHELVWKPNWLLSGELHNRPVRILVDGLNGGYYVVGC